MTAAGTSIPTGHGMNAAPDPGAQLPWRDVDGIVLLDKPEGLTSNAALQRVRRAFSARKAGHTGSLDPLASGLLPICLGQATKTSGLLLDADKTYRRARRAWRAHDDGRPRRRNSRNAPVPRSHGSAEPGRVELHRGLDTGAADVFGAQASGQATLSACPQGARVVERPARQISIRRLEILEVGARLGYARGRVQQGDLCPDPRRRPCARLRYGRPRTSLRRLRLGPFTSAPMHALDAIEEAAANGNGLESMLLPAMRRCGSAGSAARARGAGFRPPGEAVPAVGPGASRVRMYGPEAAFWASAG